MISYDPIPVLQSAGYTEREAAFLYLAALHSGYFLRRQYLDFIQRARGALAAQFLRRAIALGHIRGVACGQARFIYHLTSSEIYAAAGLGTSHHRRLKSDATIKSRLMVLDFVLNHLDGTLLDTSESKIGYFTGTLGLNESILPRSRGGVYGEEFPILINKDGVRFTFFDEGALSTSSFETFLSRYRALFHALPGFELLYLSDTTRNFDRAQQIFTAKFAGTAAVGTTSLTPRGINHLLEYLRVQKLDSAGMSLSLRELAVLREGNALYTRSEHHALMAAETVDAAQLRQRLMLQSERRHFTATLLEYRYPLHQFKFEGQPKPEFGSSVRSIRKPVVGVQVMQKQLFEEGGDA